MTTSEIENYVQSLSQGLASQGTGRFTLNKVARSPALVQLAGLHPLRWIGLVLQSAAAGQAMLARVGTNASSIGAEYSLTELHPDFHNPDFLLGENEGRHRGLRFLAEAIQWAAALSPPEIHITCEGPHSGYHIWIQGDDCKVQSLPQSVERSRVALLVTWGRGHPRRLEASASLEKMLLKQFTYYPIPLSLDSRELPLGFPVLSDWVGYWMCSPQNDRFLAVVPPCEVNHNEVWVLQGPMKRWPPPRDHRQIWLGGQVATDKLRWEELRTDWRSLVVNKTPKGEWTLPLNYVPKLPGTNRVSCSALAWTGPGQLIPVYYGMNLTAVEISGKCTVVLPGPKLQTDFSGLAAVRDEALTALLKEAAEL